MSEWNYLEWAHAQAHENLKFRLATGDLLLAQANTLLTVLVVGIGGALSYAMQLAEAGPAKPAAWAAAAVVVWLCVVAVVLAFECVATRKSDVLGNEPDNIYVPENLSDDPAVLAGGRELGDYLLSLERNPARAAALAKARRRIGRPATFKAATIKPSNQKQQIASLHFELGSLQRRITATKRRNGAVAWWLDRCRYATLATPIVFTISAMVAAGR